VALETTAFSLSNGKWSFFGNSATIKLDVYQMI